jgi:hypothetical protein
MPRCARTCAGRYPKHPWPEDPTAGGTHAARQAPDLSRLRRAAALPRGRSGAMPLVRARALLLALALPARAEPVLVLVHGTVVGERCREPVLPNSDPPAPRRWRSPCGASGRAPRRTRQTSPRPTTPATSSRPSRPRARTGPSSSPKAPAAGPPRAPRTARASDPEAPAQDRLLGVQPVLGLVEDHRMRPVHHRARRLVVAMRGQAVHEERVGLRHAPSAARSPGRGAAGCGGARAPTGGRASTPRCR